MRVKTLVPHLYNGENKTTDEVYEAEDRFVEILMGMGYVTKDEEPKPPTEDKPAQPNSSDGERPKRSGQYNRRDMRAKP